LTHFPCSDEYFNPVLGDESMNKSFFSLCTWCLCIFLFLCSGLQAKRVKEGEPVKIDFNPALEGGVPTIEIAPLPQGNDFKGKIVVTAYAWDEKEIILKTDKISGKEPYKLELPTRGHADILGVRVEQSDNDGKITKLAEWRAMFFKSGRALDYMGSALLKRPHDFKKYWREAKEKLALVPMNPKIEPVPEKNTATGRLYKVTLNSYWNIPIVCWYFVPKDVDPLHPESSKKYPAIQVMPGWGAEEPPIDRTAQGFITLSLNPKNHGPSKDYFKIPVEHHLWNIDIPEDYYYRAAFMDCRRGIDFLASRSEVNARKIGVEGGSQGGALALAMGALDERVACVCANVPYITNFPDFIRLGTVGSSTVFKQYMERADIGERVKKTLSYVDIANLAPDIKVPTLICVGAQDPVCPPLNGIVALNRIPKDVPKKLFIDKYAEHEVPDTMRVENAAWYEKYLKH